MNEALEEKIKEKLAKGDHRGALLLALYGEGALTGYQPELFKYALKELKDEQTTHDVFSRFVQNLLVGADGFRGESSFRSWAYTILKNTIFKHREAEQKNPPLVRIKVSSPDSQGGSTGQSVSESKLPIEQASPSSIVRHKEERELLSILIQKLSGPDQQILSMVVSRGLSYEEIAEELSRVLQKKVSPETIRQRYHRAQERLRKLAEEAGYC
jgi:RNA polymerase sigma factor (sigma-70 family)